MAHACYTDVRAARSGLLRRLQLRHAHGSGRAAIEAENACALWGAGDEGAAGAQQLLGRFPRSRPPSNTPLAPIIEPSLAASGPRPAPPAPPPPPDPPCAGEAVQEHVGSRTVRTSGYPGGNRLPTTPVDVPSYPIAAEPLALPRILLPSPGAWLDGHWQLARGGSAVCAGEPLVGLAALAAPAAPRADHRHAGGCSEGQEGPRRGVGRAGARVCKVRGRGLGLAGWPRSGGVGGRVLPTWQTS